jgi:CelD/BcsL family acetyltransferase involved in cellulose biosynthesis
MGYYSPGSLLLLHLVKEAQGLGIKTIDLGLGFSEQKRRFANAFVLVASGSAELLSLRYLPRTARRCAGRIVRFGRRILGRNSILGAGGEDHASPAPAKFPLPFWR